MITQLARWLVRLLALVGLCVIGAGLWFMKDGISAKPAPSAVETTVARRLRALAIPAAAAQRPNPVPASPEALTEGMTHFADHCASCHANDGSGDSAIGRGLYPRSPDMRLDATQRLSDGALFYIIENGVRLTGMPAWGTGGDEGELSSWRLVHFIRHLPMLTEAEQLEMAALNPKSAAEWQEEEAIRRFLEGEADVPPETSGPAKPPHRHP